MTTNTGANRHDSAVVGSVSETVDQLNREKREFDREARKLNWEIKWLALQTWFLENVPSVRLLEKPLLPAEWLWSYSADILRKIWLPRAVK